MCQHLSVQFQHQEERCQHLAVECQHQEERCQHLAVECQHQGERCQHLAVECQHQEEKCGFSSCTSLYKWISTRLCTNHYPNSSGFRHAHFCTNDYPHISVQMTTQILLDFSHAHTCTNEYTFSLWVFVGNTLDGRNKDKKYHHTSVTQSMSLPSYCFFCKY